MLVYEEETMDITIIIALICAAVGGFGFGFAVGQYVK